MKWLLIAGTAFLGIYLYDKYQAANRLSYSLESVVIDKNNSNLLELELDITLRVYNPSNTSLNLQRLYGNIVMNGQTIGIVDIEGAGQNLVIQKNNYTDIQFPVALSTAGLAVEVVQFFKNLLAGSGVQESVTLVATLQAEGLLLPISETQVVTLGTPPIIPAVNGKISCLCPTLN